MVLGWLPRRRRRRFLSTPLPNVWRGYLDANFANYAWLSAPERARLDGLTQILVAEKNWEGCNGLVMTGPWKLTMPRRLRLASWRSDWSKSTSRRSFRCSFTPAGTSSGKRCSSPAAW